VLAVPRRTANEIFSCGDDIFARFTAALGS